MPLGPAAQAHAGLGLTAGPWRLGARPATGGDTGLRLPPGPGRAPAAAAAPGLGSARPALSLASHRRPRLTCGLSSSVSSMGSLSIPGIVAERGRRQETRQPPTAPRARPPVAADPDPPSLTGAAAVAARAALSRRRAAAREIPPLRPHCPASRSAHWLAATPVSAAGLARRFLRGAGLRCERRPWGWRCLLAATTYPARAFRCRL